MRFHPDGPDIPAELIAAQERGEAIFLCGAGVSRSVGLPGVAKLVKGVNTALNDRLEDHDVEAEAFADPVRPCAADPRATPDPRGGQRSA